jgi:hypothetical protein
MTKEKDVGTQLDDLDATRQIASLLEPFPVPDRERIIRWAREKLGMSGGFQSGPASTPAGPLVTPASGTTPPPTDLRHFVASRRPKNDTQFAAVVAYFHRFVAPEADRKEAISPQDLLDACRLADWKRPARPRQTMLNAFRSGVFDKSGHGSYKLNPVGENLVAMVLPGDGSVAASSPSPQTATRKKKGKSAGRKKRSSR